MADKREGLSNSSHQMTAQVFNELCILNNVLQQEHPGQPLQHLKEYRHAVLVALDYSLSFNCAARCNPRLPSRQHLWQPQVLGALTVEPIVEWRDHDPPS